MSDETKPVESAPAAAPAAEDKPAETTPAPAASETPAAAESKPVDETAAKTDETPAAEGAAAAAPAEEKKTVKKEAEPIYSGTVSYKGPEKFPKNLLGPQKAHFWFGDDAVPTSKLSTFIQQAKADAHSVAAWSAQTGKGLLYYAKHEKDKEHPTGAIPLADVSDISTVGATEFTFKVHGQKHSFLTTGQREREGWLKALKAEVEAALGKKEEVTNSEGYKKTLDSLKPAVAGTSVAGASAAAATSQKKSEERGTRETNGTTKSQSRSLSRGKRGSILDRLSGKKDEVKEEVKDTVGKKDEPAKDAEAPATEPTKDAPAETEAAAVEEPKKDEAKIEEPKKAEAPKKAEEPKQTRRGSRFGDFLKNVQGKGPAQEKKADVPPAVPPKDTEAPKTDDKKEEEATAAVAAAPLPVIAGDELKKEEKKEEPKKEATPAAPKAEKKNFFDRFKPKEQPATSKPAATPAAPKEADAKPAEPVSDAPPAITEPTTTEGEAAKATTDAPALNGDAKDKEVKEAPRPSAETKEKRRSSFFSGDIAGSLKKIGQQPKKSEEKPQTNGDNAKAAAEPAKDKPAETPAAAPASKKEKEHKENPVAKLGRRFSTAIRNATKEPSKKETPAPKKAEETGASTEAKAEEPAKTEETKPAEEAKPAEGEKPVNSIGDVVPEAVNVGSAPPANATVSATA